MANEHKWEGAPSNLVLEANGSTLANNAIVQANDADYPGNTGLNTYGWIEFLGTWASAPDDSKPTIDIYIAEQPNGVNFADDPVTGGVDCEDQMLLPIPIKKIITQQRKVLGPFLLPGHAVRFFVDNQTGQSLSGAWSLTLWYNNLQTKS